LCGSLDYSNVETAKFIFWFYLYHLGQPKDELAFLKERKPLIPSGQRFLFWVSTLSFQQHTLNIPMKTPVVILGPIGATFSTAAYSILSTCMARPLLDETTEAIPASKNGDVLSILLGTPRDSVQLPWKQKREEELESTRSFYRAPSRVSEGCPFPSNQRISK